MRFFKKVTGDRFSCYLNYLHSRKVSRQPFFQPRIWIFFRVSEKKNGGEDDGDMQNPPVNSDPGTEQRVWVFRTDPGLGVTVFPPLYKAGCPFNRLLGAPFGGVLHPNLGGADLEVKEGQRVLPEAISCGGLSA